MCSAKPRRSAGVGVKGRHIFIERHAPKNVEIVIEASRQVFSALDRWFRVRRLCRQLTSTGIAFQ
jgi:hypothetical protein